jgi:hypothetical protein
VTFYVSLLIRFEERFHVIILLGIEVQVYAEKAGFVNCPP